MASIYVQNLVKTVIDNSYSDSWGAAVMEWDIIDCEEDSEMQGECICGKENIKYLYTIKNKMTGKILYPIGSSCIKKFERARLNDQISIIEGMFKLYNAILSNQRIELNSNFFSKKLLFALYEDGAFVDNCYNSYDGERDYEFMLELFKKRNKDLITVNQRKKVDAIILNSIKPYLRRNLKFKRNR